MRPIDTVVHRAVVLAPCLWPALVAAEEPLEPDRPGQTDPPSMVAPGVVQIEGGFTFERETHGQPDIDTLALPEIA
jgi:hypothetical protein